MTEAIFIVFASPIFALVLGLLIGSFLNVVVVRLPQKKSIVFPPSQCTSCKAKIRWWDNIPVVSYIFLLGKCRNCRKKISFRYPVIELLTGLLFLTARIRFGWSPLLFIHDWPFLALLVAITFIDLEHRIIPDSLSLGGLVLGLTTSWFVPSFGLSSALIGAGVGFGVFYLLAWGYEKYSGVMGLGGGDIKLLAMLGSFVGLGGVYATILIASVFGSLIGIGWGLVTGKKGLMKVSIPFGPFLVFGALYYYFLGEIYWFQFTNPI